LRTSWIASAFLSFASDGDKGPLVSNNRVSVELIDRLGDPGDHNEFATDVLLGLKVS
jgi:hypothetical protein